MIRLEIPPGVSFTDLVHHVQDYARPLRRMWPAFWLKAVAVRDEETWQLCVFHLIGRWSTEAPIQQFSEEYGGITAVSRRLDADEAWMLIRTLWTKKRVKLTERVSANVPEVTASNYVQWQQPARKTAVPEIAADVVEPAVWWYFVAGETPTWIANVNQDYLRIERGFHHDLERAGVDRFETLVAALFADLKAPPSSIPTFAALNYYINLPLALGIEFGAVDTKAEVRELRVVCRAPLSLRSMHVTTGVAWRPGATALPIRIEKSTRNDWLFGRVHVPLGAERLWFGSPSLYKPLSYEIDLPALGDVTTDALAFMYASPPHAANFRQEGEATWEMDLMHGTGARFEVALQKALARLGIPILYGGRFVIGDETGGMETPGFDLLALYPKRKHAVAISAKGTSNYPKGQEINTTLRYTEAIRQAFPGWTVFGLVACQAPENVLSQFSGRTDIKFWGSTELELLLSADRPGQITRLLWVPPWVVPETSYQYYLEYNW